jgi:2'-5' RNA ligase
MDPNSDAPLWGSFALVSYTPNPVGTFVSELRQRLPGSDNPQAHITVLPPRPLHLPVEAALERTLGILQQFDAFDVELSEVRYFSETKFIYLDVGEGSTILHDLHNALNTGDLAHREEFDFRPHLTLGGPVPENGLHHTRSLAEAAWRSSGCSSRFNIEEIVFLWLSPGNSGREWKRLWSHLLKYK